MGIKEDVQVTLPVKRSYKFLVWWRGDLIELTLQRLGADGSFILTGLEEALTCES